jgi:hypothetical protein
MIMDKCYIIHTLYNRELERDADEKSSNRLFACGAARQLIKTNNPFHGRG